MTYLNRTTVTLLCSAAITSLSLFQVGCQEQSPSQTKAGVQAEQVQAAPAVKADALRTADAPPELLLSEQKLEAIRALEKEDPLMAALLTKIRTLAEQNLTLPPNTYLQPGQRHLLNTSRAATGRIVTSAFAYRLDKDPRHLEAARRDLLNVSSFPDWSPNHYLDVAEMTLGVALGYSWLFDDLPPEEREQIAAALKNNILVAAPIAYDKERKGWLNWRGFGSGAKVTNNWNFICNTGFIAAALVLQKQEPELAEIVLSNANESLGLAIVGYAPDGAWAEGATYWSYGTGFLVHALQLLEYNDDTALIDSPGVLDTIDYGLHLFGPSGISFNFGDGGPMRDYEGTITSLSWLSMRSGRTDANPVLRKRLDKLVSGFPQPYVRTLPVGSGWRGLVFNALYFPEQTEQTAESPLKHDVHFSGDAEIIMLSSAPDSDDALWIAAKGGKNGISHGHLDLGSFVLEASGVRWAADLGADHYSLPGYWDYSEGGQRWDYYRLNNRSHNTVTLGDRLQSVAATADVIAFYTSEEKGGSATFDLTSVYPELAEKLLRHISMPARERIVVEDEVTGLVAGERFTWRMHTSATITVAPDGRTAVLKLAGKTLTVSILSAPEAAKFTSAPTDKVSEAERSNPGIRVLQIDFVPAVPDFNVQIQFLPGEVE